MGRSTCCEKKVGLKKGPWTSEEDQKLLAYIEEHGHGSWRALPAKAGLQRCGKSCRLRWTNYLRPDIKRGKFSLQEEQTIIQLHALLGNRWSAIATHLPKRTDNEIKNYWNTHLKKRLTNMGIDPVNHKPKNDALGSGQSKGAANLSHMAQWENARLEAEARLVRGSKLVANPYQPQLGSSVASASAPAQLLKKATDSTIPRSPLAPKMPPCLDVLKAWQGAWTKVPTKDAAHGTLLNSFFSSNGTLESPTPTLNFPENMFYFPSLGLVEYSSLGATNYIETSGAHEVVITKEDVQNDWKCLGIQNNFPEVKVSRENTMRLHDGLLYPTDATYVADTLRLPRFMESCTDVLPENADDDHNLTNVSGQWETVDGSCSGDFEENKNYWANIMNLMTLH